MKIAVKSVHEFIPVAEIGLILHLGRWAMDKATRRLPAGIKRLAKAALYVGGTCPHPGRAR
jgi:EAL domain-containing protein (putative c-di-GMP-specific phosphodiesterase class I)